MLQIFIVTFKGIFRDRVFRGIAICAVFFLLIPSVSALSMRQVVELSITLTLSLLSVMMLLLSVFLGGTSLWKDMERRYTYGVLGLPISRANYLLGKFFGTAAFMLLTSLMLGIVGVAVVKYVSVLYPPLRPVVWQNILLAMCFIMLKYILLVALAFLLSTVSTSFFLPIFGTLSVFFVGSAAQQVYDFLHSPSAQNYPPLLKKAVTGLYYVLPNLSAFDLSVNAAYGVSLSVSGIALTIIYFIAYIAIILTISAIVFARREMK
jgi:Cu-processing system permease protein